MKKLILAVVLAIGFVSCSDDTAPIKADAGVDAKVDVKADAGRDTNGAIQ